MTKKKKKGRTVAREGVLGLRSEGKSAGREKRNWTPKKRKKNEGNSLASGKSVDNANARGLSIGNAGFHKREKNHSEEGGGKHIPPCPKECTSNSRKGGEVARLAGLRSLVRREWEGSK